MNTLKKIFAKKESRQLFKSCILLFIFIASFTLNAVADGGPSLENVKKNSQVIKTEKAALDKQRQEELAFQEKMSYLYMFLGLAFVICVAWFSTTYYAKKNKKVVVASQNQNHHRHYIKHPHDPRRRPKVSRARR